MSLIAVEAAITIADPSTRQALIASCAPVHRPRATTSPGVDDPWSNAPELGMLARPRCDGA